jgi:hypothetical protein
MIASIEIYPELQSKNVFEAAHFNNAIVVVGFDNPA